MMSKLLALLSLVVVARGDGGGAISRDVCVVGGGASGMATAAFAQDNGYSVVVLEKKNFVGGHCKTVNFDPVIPGGDNYVDLAVQLFPDTVAASGLFPFHIDTKAFVQRFAGSDSILYNNFFVGGGTKYLVDLNLPAPFGFVNVTLAAPNPDFAPALERFFFIIINQLFLVKCPWIPRSSTF